MVLEAAYGWYWAVDALAELGAISEYLGGSCRVFVTIVGTALVQLLLVSNDQPVPTIRAPPRRAMSVISSI